MFSERDIWDIHVETGQTVKEHLEGTAVLSGELRPGLENVIGGIAAAFFMILESIQQHSRKK